MGILGWILIGIAALIVLSFAVLGALAFLAIKRWEN